MAVYYDISELITDSGVIRLYISITSIVFYFSGKITSPAVCPCDIALFVGSKQVSVYIEICVTVICLCTYVHTCIHTRTYLHIHTYTHTHSSIYTYIHAYIHTYTYVHK
jgi:hypothetical protein